MKRNRIPQYNFKKIERKWQKKWEQERLYSPDLDKAKKPFYSLMMFPYPSAEGLHIGGYFAFTGVDTFGRFKRMQGYDVFEPMGLDGFGIHSENYAMKIGEHIKDVSRRTEKNFYRQLRLTGNMFDWQRTLETYKPEYYKWTQWLFLQMFNNGLAYRKKAKVNWCPACKTVLSDEQVIGEQCERCDSVVEKKDLKQWFFRITQYAEKLNRNLDWIDWPADVKLNQRNWIGRSEGAEIKFEVRKVKLTKILVATNNGGKKERVKTLLADSGLEVNSPIDLGLESIEVSENSDLEKNAIKKAKAYYGKTDLPILANDTALFIDGEQIDPAKVKRNALGDKDESQLSQEEVVELMLDYYKNIAKKRGGQVDAYWQEVWVLLMPDGTIRKEYAKREIILTDKIKGEVDIFFPIRSIYISKVTGKYVADQSKEDALSDLEPIKEALRKLLNLQTFSKPNHQTTRSSKDRLVVFTTRPDTLFGATYMVLAPEHDIIPKLENQITNMAEVKRYQKRAQKKSEIERTTESKKKTGVKLEGVVAINPASGAKIPIFIADYILAGYGTGAIMAVPAHDERDFAFAKKYGLEIKPVVQDKKQETGSKKQELGCFSDEGININSDFLNGLETKAAQVKMIKWLEENKLGSKKITYKLRDWCISRQRYWGPPIPIVWCKECALKQAKRRKKPVKVLIIHGFESSGKDNWIPWMKKELEKLGMEVYTPSLPNSDHPDVEKWQKALDKYLARLDEDSIVIGHSLGSKTAVDLLSRTDKKIHQLFLVASALGNPRRDWEEMREKNPKQDIDALKKFWQTKTDWASVNQSVRGNSHVILSKDDPWVATKHYKLVKLDDLKVEKWNGHRHFTRAKITELRDYIVSEILEGIKPVPVPVPEKDLPVKLPPMEEFLPEGTGKGPLAKNERFVETKCPDCGAQAERETDVSDSFLDSAWYFLRYPCTDLSTKPFDKKRLKRWLPVNSYIGGKEHTVLHLLYSRFVNMVLYDQGWIDNEEPFQKFIGHGLVIKDGAKMSKSKGNVINPDEMVERYGTDTVRLYLRFMGDFAQGGDWSDSGADGMLKFVKRTWRTFFELGEVEGAGVKNLSLLDKTIKAVGEDLEKLSFNTAVARIMELINWANDNLKNFSPAEAARIQKTLALVIAPLAPHIAEEFWSLLNLAGKKGSGKKSETADSVFNQSWPTYDPGKLVDDTFQLVIQVNGKVRDKVTVKQNISEEEVTALALESEKVQKFLAGKKPRKVIYIKGRLANLVV